MKGLIFLYCEEGECFKRMKERGRPGEVEIMRQKFTKMYANMSKLQQECDFVIDCTHLVREEVAHIAVAFILEFSIKNGALKA